MFEVPEIHTPPGDRARRPTAVTEPISPGHYRIELNSQPTPALLKSTGTTVSRGRLEVSEIAEADPNSCVWTHHASSSWKRGDWDCTVEADCELRSTTEDFILSERLTARRGDAIVFESRTDSQIKRDLL